MKMTLGPASKRTQFPEYLESFCLQMLNLVCFKELNDYTIFTQMYCACVIENESVEEDDDKHITGQTVLAVGAYEHVRVLQKY